MRPSVVWLVGRGVALSVACLLVVACSSPTRSTLDDLTGQSFDSVLQVLDYGGCPLVVYSEGLIAVPPLVSGDVREMAMDAPTGWAQHYGEVVTVAAVGGGVWVFVDEDGAVVGGVDENFFMKAFCEPDSDRLRAVSS